MRTSSLAILATLGLASVTFAQESGKACFNKRDDDGDGKTDCQDPDCFNGVYGKYCTPGGKYCAPYCHSGGYHTGGGATITITKGGKESGKNCFNHRDDDGDGKTDCEDPDCLNGIYGRYCHKGGGKGKGKGGGHKGKGCGSSAHERGRCCFDGVDNDSDGQSDCEDPDCLRDRRVQQKCRKFDHRKGTKHERGKACFDGKDNDGDGQKDCQDPDCRKDRRTARICHMKVSKGNDGASEMPKGCVRWYDGCNICQRQNMNSPMRCTKRMCFRQGKARCRSYDRAYHGGGH